MPIIPQSNDGERLSGLGEVSGIVDSISPETFELLTEFNSFANGVINRYIGDGQIARGNDARAARDYILSYVHRWFPIENGFTFVIDRWTRLSVRMLNHNNALLLERSNGEGTILDRNDGYLRQGAALLEFAGITMERGIIRPEDAPAPPQAQSTLTPIADAHNNAENELYCGNCRRVHKKYGAEMEINALTNDSAYRSVFLRMMNQRMDLSSSSSDYGIDGAGRALEMRNINADSIEELTNEMQTRLDKFLGGLEDLSEKFPSFSKRTDNQICGIHIHQWHKGIARHKVVAVHSLVGMMVNQFYDGSWESRAGSGNGYGTPMNPGVTYRDSVPWCRGQVDGTELRMFCMVSPSVIKYALELQNELIESMGDMRGSPQVHYDAMRRIQGSIVSREGFTRRVRYLVNMGVASVDKVKEIHDHLKSIAKDYKGRAVNSEGLMDMVMLNLPASASVQVVAPPPIVPLRTATEALRNIRESIAVASAHGQASQQNQSGARPQINETAGRGSWCARIRTIMRSDNPVLHLRARFYRNSLRRHLQSCMTCRDRVTWNAPRNGYELVTRENPSVISFERTQNAGV